MPADDYQIPVNGESHWITVYRGDPPEVNDRTLCRYYCPKLGEDGVHTCRIFGTVLKTLEKPSVANEGSSTTIAHRCEKCLDASTFAEKW